MLFIWKKGLCYFFHHFRQAFFTYPAIDVHGQLGRCVTGKDLGFFDADPAFDHRIDISYPAPMEVELSTSGILLDASGLQVPVQVAGLIRRDISGRRA